MGLLVKCPGQPIPSTVSPFLDSKAAEEGKFPWLHQPELDGSDGGEQEIKQGVYSRRKLLEVEQQVLVM